MSAFVILISSIILISTNGDSYNGINLLEGQQLKQNISYDLQYFRINLTQHDDETNLHIYVTPIGNCDPNLYVSWDYDMNSDDYQYPQRSEQYDAVSNNIGAEFIIINYANYSKNNYIYITIQPFIPGEYTILYRFNKNENNVINAMTINDNIPQFFIIHQIPSSDTPNHYQLFAAIEFKINIDINKSFTNVLSFYIDSYIADDVWFKCWITINKPQSYTNVEENINVLYQHIDPLISELRLKSDDPKSIKCIKNIITNITTCHGYDQNGKSKSIDMIHTTNDIYFIVQVIDDSTITSNDLKKLQITLNQQPLYNKTSSSSTKITCTDPNNDCGPRGQLPSEQLPLFQDETMWNALIVRFLLFFSLLIVKFQIID